MTLTSKLIIASYLLYILACRFTVRKLSGFWRNFIFAWLNIGAAYFVFFFRSDSQTNESFCACLGVLLFQYAMLRFFAEKKGWRPWIAFFAPLSILAVVRYVPPHVFTSLRASLHAGWIIDPWFIGISYMAFRSSHLVLEIRNGVVKRPDLWEYIGFCLFVPTIPVGPISPYSLFHSAFEGKPVEIPPGRAVLRVIVGLIKYLFIGTFFGRLAYSNTLLNDNRHHWIDLPVAIFCYSIFLYNNFSGVCDVAVGAAGLMGIPVAENFNMPYAARNVQDYWNRWHITLSHWMRDVVFTPLTKALVNLMGPRNVNHAVGISIVAVFLLVGIWHGVGWNYAAFGAAHALALAVNHYYAIWLKQRLGREGFKAYVANKWIHAAAVTVTFSYCSCALFLFANTFPEMTKILSSLRW
jgi:D-alanyl-lipoteichoic acid acyltransferase DltB (MBOAT superfamily)